MMNTTKDLPLIATGVLTRETLAGKVAVISGAGRGIGFEAARALVWLGVHVVIAEIDEWTGGEAAHRLVEEMGEGVATFVHTDVGDTHSVVRLARQVLGRYGHVDIVLNNATIAPMGAVIETAIQAWDAGYRVNVRGPVLMARAFLPRMIAENEGVFVCVSSSGVAPYMGPYEVFKTAQAELAHTLDGEMAGTGVAVLTISPGLVRTAGADAAVAQLAPLYGKTVEEFYAMSADQLFSVETAGSGFAAAIALASRFRGQEISVIQALQAAGIPLPERRMGKRTVLDLTPPEIEEALALSRAVRSTLSREYEGWKQLPLKEEQRVLREFETNTGMAPRPWLDLLAWTEHSLATGDLKELASMKLPLHRLAGYFKLLQTQATGHEQDPHKLEAQLRTVRGMQRDTEHLVALLAPNGA